MLSVFLSKNNRLLKKYNNTLLSINALESEISSLSDSQIVERFNSSKNFLRSITNGFKVDKANKGYQKNLEQVFAIVREVGKRTLLMRHFDVQIIGGLILNDGKIAEMKTGEGKTFVATLPAVFNAACGIPVHVITANDYLCERDYEAMSPIYNFLGLSCGFVNSTVPLSTRGDIYSKDIIYATNNEIGFDYLRDNMRQTLTPFLQKGLGYAMVDEIDLILIDEARTPLIISGSLDIPTDLYKIADKITKQIDDIFIEIDEKTRQVHLKDEAYDKIETLLKQYGITSDDEYVYGHHHSIDIKHKKISTSPDFYIRASKIMNCIEQSFKANKIFKKDTDYIIKNQSIQIVDEFTGRVLEGRRYSDGLHQAIEAKHGVQILQESQTLASISYQNLFRLYHKLSGMTGTAKTEEDEFISIYKLDVVSVPTNKPMIREDMDDFVFATEDEKFEAISLKVKELYEKGQPVLVGTASINKSEKLSSYFKKHNIPHVVLNAKNHSKEAEIIAQAGRLKTVTIATNMAGRGTDIILGGNIEHQIATLKDLKDQDKKLKIIEEQKINNQKVKDLGGLFVIGSERHESRRIDNQLRGRSGRQGDIGSSQFYLSLEDDLLRIFGGEKIKSLLMKVGLKKGEVINHSFLNTVIRKAQEKVENYNFDIRKNLLQYDNVINDQRIVFYSIRRSVVENSANFKSELIEYYTELCEHFDNLLKLGEFNENGEVSKTLLSESLSRVFPIDTLIDASNIDLIDSSEFYNRIKTSAKNLIEKFYDKQLNQDSLDMIRSIFLHCLDSNWKDHLHSIDSIKSSISLRSYAQKDPLNEYKIESYHSFDQMLFRFKSMVLFSSLINFWKNIEFN